jgi:hypothetical protein
MEKYGLTNKVVSITTDNASAMIAACRLLGIPRIACFAHVFNLLLGDVIDLYTNEIRPLVRLAGKSRKSPRFALICKESGVRKQSLTTFSKTRFYSMYKLLKTALELRPQVMRFRAELSKTPPSKTQIMPEGASSSDILRHLDDAFDDGEPPPSDYELEQALQTAEVLLPIVDVFRVSIAMIEGDDSGLLSFVLPAFSHIKETILGCNDERIRGAWPSVEAHWRRLVPKADELVLAGACLLRRALPHEAILAVIDPELYINAISALRVEVENHTTRFIARGRLSPLPSTRERRTGWETG